MLRRRKSVKLVLVSEDFAKVRATLFLFFLLVSSFLAAQSLNPFQPQSINSPNEWRSALEDSLKQLKDDDVDKVMTSHLSQMGENANLAWYYYIWAKRMLSVDRGRSSSLFKEGIKYSQRAEEPDLEARYHMSMSDVLPIPELGERQRQLKLADSLSTSSPDHKLKFGIQQRLAVLYSQMANPTGNQIHRDKALEVLEHIKDANVKAAFYMNMSIFLQKFIGADTALFYLNKASALDSILPITEAKIYFQKAKLNIQLGQSDSVAINLNKSYSIFLELNDARGVQLTLQLMSRNYANQGFYQKAISLGPRLRKYVPKEELFGYYYDMANFNMLIDELETANQYLDSIAQVTTEKSPFQVQVIYTSLKGELSYKLGQKRDGLSNMFQAYKMFDDRGLKDQALGAMYIFTRNCADVLINDSFISLPEHGINDETDLLRIFETITADEVAKGKMNFQSHAIFQAQGLLYRKTGQPQKAFDYLLMGQARKDSIENQEKSKNVLEFSQKTKELEMAKTEAELRATNAANKADRDRQRNEKVAILVIAVFLLIIAGLIFLQLRKSRTHSQQLEAQKAVIEEQRDELAKLDTMKSNFFANISHELRTPLTLILGPLTEVVKKRKAELPNDVGQLLQLAYRNGGKIRELVNEILDLGKLESGQLKVETEPAELYSLCKRVFYTFESLAVIKNIQLNFECNLTYPKAYHVDVTKLDRILSNLLSNAIKFTGTNGSVTLSVEMKGEMIVFKVMDTGDGIHPEDLEKIFDRYYQSPHQKEGAGTGIGLSFAHQLARLLGGDLIAESELGKGSVFTVSLPLKEGEQEIWLEQEPDEPQEEESEKIDIIPEKLGAKHNLLVVEDNTEMQQFLQASLSSDFRVTLCDNGVEALKELEKHSFDLILSDFMMPKMDGMELLGHIKNNPHWKNIPFVMLTAIARDSEKVKALNVGLDDYLLKPFNVDELLARINNLIGNHRERTGKEPETNEDQQWLKKVQELTEEKLTEEHFNVAWLADQLNMIERQLYRKMKKLTGLTPNKFIQEIRLRKARGFLEAGTFKTVKEVSLAIGFDSFHHFSKIYTERFGKRPTEYLKSNKNEG